MHFPESPLLPGAESRAGCAGRVGNRPGIERHVGEENLPKFNPLQHGVKAVAVKGFTARTSEAGIFFHRHRRVCISQSRVAFGRVAAFDAIVTSGQIIRNESLHRLIGDDQDGNADHRHRHNEEEQQQALILSPLFLTTLTRFTCAAFLCHAFLTS